MAWTYCSGQYQLCTLPAGTYDIQYGSGAGVYTKTGVTGSIQCEGWYMGAPGIEIDPNPGGSKYCYYQPSAAPDPDPDPDPGTGPGTGTTIQCTGGACTVTLDMKHTLDLNTDLSPERMADMGLLFAAFFGAAVVILGVRKLYDLFDRGPHGSD